MTDGVVRYGGGSQLVSGAGGDDTANVTAKIPVIPARANAVSPSFTEGFMVPLSTDLRGLLRTSIPELGNSAALGALNATVSTGMLGQGSAGLTIDAGTLDATLIPEVSNDNGDSWVATFFADPVTRQKIGSLVLTNPNAVTVRSVLVSAGATDVRVRVFAYNSGTATATVTTTTANDPTITYDNPTGVATAPTFVQIAGMDGTNTRALRADVSGFLITRPHVALEDILSERVADTTGTSTDFTTFGAGGSGVHNYVTSISVMNTSATAAFVDIRDGSAGAIIFTVPAPANAGSTIPFPVPLKGADNTALAYDVSAALSTVYISLVGFQGVG